MSKPFSTIIEEIANNIGAGNIASPDFLLGRQPRPIRRDRFAESEVFVVNTGLMHSCMRSVNYNESWDSGLNDTEVSKEIKKYAEQYPDKRIIIKDENTGYMMYLR